MDDSASPGVTSTTMDLDKELISSVYGRHPARTMPFDELRESLRAATRAQNVVVARSDSLEIYMYSNGCRFENRWDLFSLMARGLILDVQAKRVVATPFPKFFNFGELITTLPDEPFEVTEKIDGSLGIVFEHNGHWIVSTKGSLTSEQSVWATAHLADTIDTVALTPGVTYLVEIVYRQNRIVIPYDFEGLVLLGAYDQDGHELTRDQLREIALQTGLRLVESHAHQSLDELLHVCRALPRDREGFVVRFRGGLRIKLKGEQYCRIHKLISRCTPLALWDAMMNCEDLDQIRSELPEEMTRDFDHIRRALEQRLASLEADVRAAVERTAHLDDKATGLLLQSPESGLTDAQRKFLFMARKARFFEHLNEPGEARRKAFLFLRPDRNELPGYEPSNAMTRFQVESA
jgi:RNA ligase